MEKELNGYIGDVVNGLAKEAAFYKAKCMDLERQVKLISDELIELKKQPRTPDSANYADMGVDSGS